MTARRRNRRTGCEEVTGETPNIAEWLDFKFCDPVWWIDRKNKPNINDDIRRLA